jgi:UDP-N-acetylglucosamine 2-epimerase (non-hydrolysing)
VRRILFIFGTRPEAIKLSPVIRHLRACPGRVEAQVCVTGQHRSMLDQVMCAFAVHPDYDLDVMQAGQTLAETTSRILAALSPVLRECAPDMCIVQGDTTSTLAGALASFYARIPVGHVEAGLRTGDMAQPFPEEMNRVVAGRLAGLHFAPTPGARANLLAEGVAPGRIVVTGNPGIDAVLYVRDALDAGRLAVPDWPWLDPSKHLVVVTAHRRESFGEGFERICDALEQLAARGDVQIVYPVHRNPNVLGCVTRRLAKTPNIVLLDPLEYVAFVDLMRRAHLILTDSGGIQEEAPSLGKPVLVLRDKTERPEAVEAGTVKLVGTGTGQIVTAVARLLEDRAECERMCRVHNPYGDGTASRRIAEAVEGYLSGSGR